jgi:hypothetical protein
VLSSLVVGDAAFTAAIIARVWRRGTGRMRMGTMLDEAGPLRYHDAARGCVCDDCGPVSGAVLPVAAGRT